MSELFKFILEYSGPLVGLVAVFVYAVFECIKLHRANYTRYNGHNPRQCFNCGKKRCQLEKRYNGIECWRCEKCNSFFNYPIEQENK